MAELDAVGVAAVFAADAEFQVGVGLAAVLCGHADELADAVAVERLEGVDGKDFHLAFDAWLLQAIDVFEQELAFGVVAAEAKGGLGQVVGAEAEEVGDGRDLAGGQGGTRQFDHGAELVLDGGTGLGGDLFGDGLKLATHFLQLVDMADEGDHDLGMELLALLCQFAGGFEDGACLHDVDFGEEQAQAAAAQAEHGVHLAHGADGL